MDDIPDAKKKKKLSRFQSSLNSQYRYVIDDTIKYLKDQGWNNMAISGVLGNMSQESEFNPYAVGPGGFSGTVQMSSDMANEIKRVYGKVDYKTTNQFIHDAMSGNSKISKPWINYMKQNGGYYGKTFNSASDAAMAFGRVFERPTEKYANWTSRKQSAEHALEYLNQMYPEKNPLNTEFPGNMVKPFKPVDIIANKINTQYPIEDKTPKPISSWSGADAPNATPRLKDFQEIQNQMSQQDVWNTFDNVTAWGKRRVAKPDSEKMLADNMQQYIKDIINLPKPEDATPTFARFMIPNPFYS